MSANSLWSGSFKTTKKKNEFKQYLIFDEKMFSYFIEKELTKDYKSLIAAAFIFNKCVKHQNKLSNGYKRLYWSKRQIENDLKDAFPNLNISRFSIEQALRILKSNFGIQYKKNENKKSKKACANHNINYKDIYYYLFWDHNKNLKYSDFYDFLYHQKKIKNSGSKNYIFRSIDKCIKIAKSILNFLSKNKVELDALHQKFNDFVLGYNININSSISIDEETELIDDFEYVETFEFDV